MTKQLWEQRWHPFRGEWVLFAAHRSGRPWVGAELGSSSMTNESNPDVKAAELRGVSDRLYR